MSRFKINKWGKNTFEYIAENDILDFSTDIEMSEH